MVNVWHKSEVRVAIFMMLSRFSPHSVGDIKSLARLDTQLDRQLRAEHPRVKRLASYALLGDYDFLNIFEAPDATTAAQVALLLQAMGMGTTQTLTAIPFHEFRELVEDI